MTNNINRYIATALFFMAILCSLVSQAPIILESGNDKTLKMIWVLPFVYALFSTPHNLLNNRLMPYYGFYLLFFLYCFSCQMFTGGHYFTQDLYNMAICLMITIVSYCYWLHNSSQYALQTICAISLVCGVFLSLDVYVNYLAGANIMSASYAYDEKNSLGQILLCIIFISILFFKPKDKRILWASRLCMLFMLLVMILLKSRATFVSALYILYTPQRKQEAKNSHSDYRTTSLCLSPGQCKCLRCHRKWYRIRWQKQLRPKLPDFQSRYSVCYCAETYTTTSLGWSRRILCRLSAIEPSYRIWHHRPYDSNLFSVLPVPFTQHES